MDKFLQYGLLAAAGWFVYNNFFKGTNEQVQETNGSGPAPSVNIRELMQAEATSKGYPPLMNSWQWGIVYQAVRKVEPPDLWAAVPEGQSGEWAMSLDEWLSRMIPAGVSGIFRS